MGGLKVVASLALAMGVLVAPGFALGHGAQGFQNTGPVVGGATLGTSRSVAVPFPDRRFISRSRVRPFTRPIFPSAIVATAPAVVYAPPPPYYAPPAYYDPPMGYSGPISYSPPVSYAPAASVTALAPMPSVVQFPTGRYELRGDGLSIPYAWVWMPNAPTAPPVAAPPPSIAPPAVEPISDRPATPRRSQLYRWTDAQGAEHWTDRLEAVPEQYRARAKQTPS